jgi:DNA-binding NtrC family response regulator
MIQREGRHITDSPRVTDARCDRLTLKMIISRIEKRIIISSLAHHQWKKSHTARDLGLSRMGLDKKLHRHGIDVTHLKGVSGSHLKI